MGQAFVRKGDEQSLAEISPTLPALINFITRDNNGVSVYEKKLLNINGQSVHKMSNGLCYAKDENGRWSIVEI